MLAGRGGIDQTRFAGETGFETSPLIFVDGALLDRFVDQGDRLGNEFLGGFLLVRLNGFSELFDLAAEDSFVLPVYDILPDTAAVLANG
jgi:hypothetical protein